VNLPPLRFIFGMANEALVVTEPVYDPFPFIAGRHVVSASVDEIPAVVLNYLQDEEQRRQITGRAYAFVTQELTLERSIERMLELIAAKGLIPT